MDAYIPPYDTSKGPINRSIDRQTGEWTPEHYLWASFLAHNMSEARGIEQGWDRICRDCHYNDPRCKCTRKISDKCKGTRHNNRQCAINWLKSNARHEGSFLWVCDLFGYEPEWYRRLAFNDEAGSVASRVRLPEPAALLKTPNSPASET